VQGMINSLNWHLDGRIHMQCGGGNRGLITRPGKSDVKGVEIGGKDFWFDPRTLEFGTETGSAQYGMSFDSAGRKFACSNSDHLQHYPYDDRYGQRNPQGGLPASRRSVAADGPAAEVFRISPDEPWRIIRTRLRVSGVVKGAVEGSGRVSGYFTGATGTTVYRGDAYGPEFEDNTFTGDAGGQLIHRKVLRPDGISVLGERPADERKAEFAASRDTWVRVVNFANAPDGHLYVCDMYREVIEHPWSIPDQIKQHLDLNSGHDRGRIWRIAKEDGARRGLAGLGEKKPANCTSAELVTLLGHANGWHRDCAARLLCERGDPGALPWLKDLFQGPSGMAKRHALGVLEVMHSLDDAVLLAALADGDAVVRELAVLALEKHGKVNDEVAFQLKGLARDEALRVKLQLAFSLPHLQAHVVPSVAADMLQAARQRLADAAAKERVLAEALASAPAEWVEALALERMAMAQAADELLPRLLITVGAMKRRVPEALAAMRVETSAGPLVKALAEGLGKAGKSLREVDAEGKLTPLFEQAVSTLRDAKESLGKRLDAASLLALHPTEEAQAAMLSCLKWQEPEALQVGLIPELTKSQGASLLEQWPGLHPAAQRGLIDALSARGHEAKALLASVGKEGKPQAKDFSASQVQTLIQSRDAGLAKAARDALKAVIPASREEVLHQFASAVELKGDGAKGVIQFLGRCAACHQAKGQGIAVGPDLVTVKTRGRSGILEAILHPNKEVAPPFMSHTMETKAGQTVAGIIVQDEAASVTLQMMGGVKQTLQRSEIAGTRSAGQSLMPEGLEQGMKPQDMADLLAYIEGL
jgi:putative membrane-bound dehydrogenase-like protein